MEIIGHLFAAVLSAYIVIYLADILPAARKISPPICSYCGERIFMGEYLQIWKKCTSCQKRRVHRNFAVLVLSLLISLRLNFSPPDAVSVLLAWPLLTYLGLVVVVDIEHKLILHTTSIFGALLGLTIGVLYNGLTETILGFLAGFAIMLVFYWLGGVFVKILSRIRKTDIEEIPLGFGDVNLAAIMGLILGFPGILTGLIIAIFSAGIVSLIVFISAVVQRQNTAELIIPYGPFLTIAVWMAVLF